MNIKILIIFLVFLAGFWFVFVDEARAEWVSPTGYNDPDNAWSDEPYVYDGDTGTRANNGATSPGNYSAFLELTFPQKTISKVGEYIFTYGNPWYADIDVYDGSWHNCWEGTRTSSYQWVEHECGASYNATKIRIRAYDTATGNQFRLAEVQVWEQIIEPPSPEEMCIKPDGWNNWDTTCYTEIYFEDPMPGSGLGGCSYRIISDDEEPGLWNHMLCGGCTGRATSTCYVPMTIGDGEECRHAGEGACKIEAWAWDFIGNANTKIQPYNIVADTTPPSCDIKLYQTGATNLITEVNIGQPFDIYVGNSLDTGSGIASTTFSNDDSQDNIPQGGWTSWYDWNVSSGDWNAATKRRAWNFATGGSKEVWVKLKDGAENESQCKANIYVNMPPISTIYRWDGATYDRDNGNSWHKNDFTRYIHDLDTDGSLNQCEFYIYDNIASQLTVSGIRTPCNNGAFNSKQITVGENKDCPGQGKNACSLGVRSRDNDGAYSEYDIVTYHIDYTPPVVGITSPNTALEGVAQDYSAIVSDNIEVGYCWLYAEKADKNYDLVPMEFHLVSCDDGNPQSSCPGNTNCLACAEYNFTDIASPSEKRSMFAQCADHWDRQTGSYLNVTAGEPVEVLVSANEEGLPPSSTIYLDCSYQQKDLGGSWYNSDFSRCAYDYDPERELDTCSYFVYDTTSRTYTHGPVERNCNAYICDKGAFPCKITVGSGKYCPSEGENACSLYIYSADQAGNDSLYYVATYHIDWTPPEVGLVSPTTAQEGIKQTYSATVSDNIELNYCWLYVEKADGSFINFPMNFYDESCNVGPKLESCQQNSHGECKACAEYIFTDIAQSEESRTMYVRCADHWDSQTRSYLNVTEGPETEIIVSSVLCTPGEEVECITPQGCPTTIICLADGSWPDCLDEGHECTRGTILGCGYCGTQVCDDNCQLGECFGEGECPPNTLNCPLCLCPSDSCAGSTYYDYPPHGDCYANCVCNTDTGSGEPCEPTPSPNDGRCDISLSVDLKVATDAETWQDGLSSSGSLYGVDFKAAVSGTMSGTITFEFCCQNEELISTFEGLNCTSPDEDWVNRTDKEGNLRATKIISPDVFAVKDLCGYSSPGEHSAKVRVERGTSGAEDTASITVINNPPMAAIACHPRGCAQPAGACSGYTGTGFCLKNNSTDPQGLDDIYNSIWTINAYTHNCRQINPLNPVCNITPTLSAGNYTAHLEVIDQAGESHTTTRDFTILQDVIADFDCSLSSEGPWQLCNTLRVTEGEVVYFRNKSVASDGANFDNANPWSWTFKDGAPSASNLKNPSTTFQIVDAGSGQVTLSVIDSNNRPDSVSYQVRVTRPLPKWWEIAPF